VTAPEDRAGKAIEELEKATGRLLRADRADGPLFRSAMSARHAAVVGLREALAKNPRRLSPEERERILRCRQRGEELNRSLLAERETLRANWKRLSDGSHLLQALPRDDASGLRLDVKG